MSIKNSGVTFEDQGKLSRLPIPNFEETLENFRYVLQALQIAEKLEETKTYLEFSTC
jgi:hypothetical protein